MFLGERSTLSPGDETPQSQPGSCSAVECQAVSKPLDTDVPTGGRDDKAKVSGLEVKSQVKSCQVASV